MALTDEAGLVDAYSTTGHRWQHGPGRIYDRLAQLLLASAPVPVAGALVLDVGAGTGAASRAAIAAGARAVALDPAVGMLTVDATTRPPAVAGDTRRLPLRPGCVDLAVAAFSLNHLPDPGNALGEIRAVLRPGGGVVAGTYADDDDHPVKDTVQSTLTDFGWTAPDWYRWVQDHTVGGTATVDRMEALATAAGYVGIQTEHRRVGLPELTPRDLVEWRLGMAHHAPFVATRSADERRRIVDLALDRLGPEHEPLERSVVVLRARNPSPQHPVHPRGETGGVRAG